ncbi:MAG: hypothetical protein JSV91_02230 [Phycisphaerales bacterium]|nr:MAG: hypothetical protein JSV91_02230 [Phycisphaerales bacterium]
MISQFSSHHAAAAAFAAFAAGIAGAGQWQDEFAITQDPWTQYRSYISTAPDDTVYVLWPDWTDWEDTKVNLMKSADHGQTWEGPWIIFEGLAYENMDLCADAEAVHVLLVEFYEDEVNEYKLLYHTKSLDGGLTFTPPVRVGERENIEMIRLYTHGGVIYVYAQHYDFDQDIAYNYLYVSTDGGENWQEKPMLPAWDLHHPALAFRNGDIHMAFGGFLAVPDIMYSQSKDQGDTWSTPVPVSSGAGSHSQLPQIALDDNAVHVAWEDDRTDHFNIIYTRSTDGGQTWSVDEQLNDTYYAARVKLLSDDEGVHAVWCQYHGDDGWPSSWSSADYGIVWYKFSDDAGLSWTDEFRVSQNESIPPIDLPDMGANHVKLAPYTDGFCAMWQDKRDGNIDLYLRNNLRDTCPADVNNDQTVDIDDLFQVLGAWGTCDDCPEDVNDSGVVDIDDIFEILGNWGPCP